MPIIFILYLLGIFMICLCHSGSAVLPELLYFILHFLFITCLMVPFILLLFKTIATVCVFLASKVEDTPCPLDLVVRVGYETMYRRDPVTAHRIRQKDVFEKQKALILTGERLVLTTIRFNFNIQHPYRPLHDAMKNLGIIQKEVKQVAWNFVNDWLKTTLCLQFKPQYIAAGSLYLTAKVHNIKLPLHGPHVWWHQFDVAPKPLEDVIQQMMEHVALNKLMPARPSPVKQKETLSEAKLIISNSPDSVLNQSSLSISNLSPDISEPSDHIHSSQFLINSHIGDCTISGPDSSSLSVNSNRDTASKEHDKDSLDRGTITKHGDGLMSCRNQKSLDVILATEENTECMKQDVSHLIDASTVNGDDRNQASRDQHGDGVQPFSEVISLDADMDRRNTRMELSAANSNSCTKSLDADSVCSDKRLTNAATGLVDGAPSAPPVEIEVDHLSAELKKVDVARIKD
jgi:cyclin T